MNDGQTPKDGLPFRRYLSLGDSISIDRYPALDQQEREGASAPITGLGAASLLYRNDDRRWPEFAGRDLVSAREEIEWTDLSMDGATVTTVLESQLPRLPDHVPEPTLVTLTVGGNDFLRLLGSAHEEGEIAARLRNDVVEDILSGFREILRRLDDRVPEGQVVVGTVYDPTDGTGVLRDGRERSVLLEHLHDLNRSLEEIAADFGARTVDIHDHFLGHGLSEDDPSQRWYWHPMIIEPSARGASEVRRLWVEEIGL